MFTESFVYILINNDGKFVNAYSSRELAEGDLPEALHQKKTQINRTDWSYGEFSSAWKILERKVLGSSGLPLASREYRENPVG